jgi:5-methyltetrahydrofolate--homocysteine methyltransferase
MTVEKIREMVLEFEEEEVASLVQSEIDAGTDVKTILDQGLIAPLDLIGEQFSAGTLFVPEMLMAAEAVQAGLDILRPLLAETGTKPLGTIAIGTVKGDLHDIGKNLVSMMLEGAGFHLIDLGTDVAAEQFISAAQEHDADIVAISGLLTTSLSQMEAAVAAIQDANQNRNINVKVMVGGPPVTQEFAESVGAHGYGIDAPGAVNLARNFIEAEH